MYQGTKQERDSEYYKNVSSYKSNLFCSSPAKIFVESDDRLAKRIAKKSNGKKVICPDSGKIYYVKKI